MMNLCAIGNSHIAAMMLGWKQIEAEFPEVKLTFFGAPGALMDNLVVDGDSLTAGGLALRRHCERTGSASRIPASFDSFLLCALDFNLMKIRPLFERYRLEAHAADSRVLISDECYLRSAQGCLRGSLAVSTAKKLRQISAASIMLIPQPMPGENCAKGWLGRLKRNQEEQSVADYFDQAAADVADELDIELIPQPAHTKSSALQTSDLYNRGAIRLRGGLSVQHREADSLHMNAEYGSVVLRDALRSLHPLQPSRRPDRSASAS